jgi:hypothetical protein
MSDLPAPKDFNAFDGKWVRWDELTEDQREFMKAMPQTVNKGVQMVWSPVVADYVTVPSNNGAGGYLLRTTSMHDGPDFETWLKEQHSVE